MGDYPPQPKQEQEHRQPPQQQPPNQLPSISPRSHHGLHNNTGNNRRFQSPTFLLGSLLIRNADARGCGSALS